MAVTFLDTTLRDGAQGIGISFSLQDKLDITERLDAFGIDYIEGGFPLASERESEYFRHAKMLNLKHAKLVAFGSTRRPDASVDQDANIKALLEAETPTVVVVGKGWDAHVHKVIGTSLEENLRMIDDSISGFKQRNREVIIDIEHFFDGYFSNQDYSLQVLRTALDSGADRIVLCDTNGGTLPHQVSEVFDRLKQENIPPERLGIHCHNDAECAVACSLAAVAAGALHVHGTINGIGERCGNANLISIIPNVSLKMGIEVQCSPQLSGLTELSRYISEKTNAVPDRKQPYVGDAAFGHKAGQHADVILKDSALMEHIDSAKVGNQRHLVVSELAGRASVLPLLQELHNTHKSKMGSQNSNPSQSKSLEKNSPEVRNLIRRIKTREAGGYLYEAAEASLELEARRVLGIFRPLFEMTNYHIEIFRTREFESQTVGRLFLKAKLDDEGEVLDLMGAGVGDGPVATLDAAIRNALFLNHIDDTEKDNKPNNHFAFLKELSLVDYRVRVINPEDATNACVRVVISSACGSLPKTWDTVGVSKNIVDASIQALKDSYDYYYNRFILNQ
ncbi:citramalate synthase [Candidatus Haliotispira prima]|uniref:Citramalate synthase n=1 Tax=Candidatus Haliotispira prima TaxID=3034016 RepID=A0ABY8ML18_9SPIO|nr:citramalate synthase [Candidatus Haliotispira prima]